MIFSPDGATELEIHEDKLSQAGRIMGPGCLGARDLQMLMLLDLTTGTLLETYSDHPQFNIPQPSNYRATGAGHQCFEATSLAFCAWLRAFLDPVAQWP